MTIDEIIEKLNSKKSADRRRGAKEIGKLKIVQLGEELYQKYVIEKLDKRTWETQYEMIKALGSIEFKKAIEEIEQIVRTNIPHDMITMASGTTYVQLKRKSIHDAAPVLELLEFGSISVIDGALLALAIDQMKPNENEIRKILSYCKDINKHKDRIGHEFGLIDSRQYLAIACANWDIELTKDFLNHCIDTAYDINSFGKPVINQNLIDVCKNSLKGKFSKAYLL
ncbi:hypothetical protein [Chryseobacterium sp. SIMBA_029]|uniref:hypothetical protein n=1 Tax=Chryseobacterium sp. SIMBA_029 TaxID=3085772 RepID=UPI00397929DD